MTNAFPWNPIRASDLRHALEAAGYRGSRVSRLLNVAEDELVRGTARIARFLRAKESLRREPLGLLTQLLLFTQPVRADSLERSPETRLVTRALSELGCLEKKQRQLRSRVAITPFRGLLLISDPLLRAQPGVQAVMPPHASTLAMLGTASDLAGGKILDLGCGSGAIALLLAQRQLSVTGTDINPRAVEYARFNASLNGLAVAFTTNDELLNEGRTADRILFNSPGGPHFCGELAALEDPMSTDDALVAAATVGQAVLTPGGTIDVFAILEFTEARPLHLDTSASLERTGFRVVGWREATCPELRVTSDHLKRGRLDGRTALVSSASEGAQMVAYLRAQQVSELVPACVTLARG